MRYGYNKYINGLKRRIYPMSMLIYWQYGCLNQCDGDGDGDELYY